MTTGPPLRYFQVVVNVRGQYGIWPLDDAMPGGWSQIGFVSTRDECLVHVAELWWDMRPRGKPDLADDEPDGWRSRITEVAAARPDAVALSDASRHLTYGELVEDARRLAGRLAALGVRTEDRVALCLPLGAPALTAILGVALTGAAYLPIDSADDEDWRDLVIADSGVRVVVTDRPETLAHIGADLVTWPDPEGRRDAGPPAPESEALSSDAACVLYHPADRGSRGVVLENRQLDALLAGAPPIHAGDRVSVSGRLSCELVNADVLYTLSGGAEVVLSHDDPTARPGPWRHSSYFYGSLETGVVCAACTVLNGGTGPARVLIGPPFPGCRLYALDEDIRPLSVGDAGALYVGGRVVARGYLDDPAATVNRFVPDPFAADGSRMFATEHRVRLNDDGVLERLDDGPVRTPGG
ncbi:AMP-binding protein [Streptosporangium lutulentum]|uniref:Non-ribosomal peptide synthetase component F n=1 Tax=Streptosporangium lutulentum TaxID=1461250 RepID=A0ABT9QTD1_9ACTN|nr:AMP-binding protein [Streptosporangium lutulentum]MDP9850022.1 non-ribosomal peptide synthetase component F [Streptosporangium lutulentum]